MDSWAVLSLRDNYHVISSTAGCLHHVLTLTVGFPYRAFTFSHSVVSAALILSSGQSYLQFICWFLCMKCDYCSFFPAACPPSWKTSLCSESSVLLSVRTSPPLFIVLTHFFPPQVVVPNIGRKACALLATRTNYNQCADVPKSHNPPLLFFLVSRSHQWIFLSTPGDISFHFSHVRLGVFWGDHGMSDHLHPWSSQTKQVF